MLCDDRTLAALVATIEAQDGEDLAATDRLLADYPDDPRLHFLRGSMLAGIGRSIEALAALRRAVALAPDFALARFQLGFFQLTSGEAADALSSWGPLALLADGDPLRLFVTGLTHLIRDEFDLAERVLKDGVAANRDNAALNRDIGLIIAQIEAIRAASAAAEPMPATSATSFLLGQFTAPDRLN